MDIDIKKNATNDAMAQKMAENMKKAPEKQAQKPGAGAVTSGEAGKPAGTPDEKAFYDFMKDFCSGCTRPSVVGIPCTAMRKPLPTPEEISGQLDDIGKELELLEFIVDLLEDIIGDCDDEDDFDLDFMDDDDDEDYMDAVVLVLTPGKTPQIMTCGEACDEMPCYYENYECIEDFAGMGVSLYYRKDQVIQIGDKTFLTGPAVVCYEDEDAELDSLDGEDIYEALHYAEEHRAILRKGAEEIPAIRLPQ